MRGGSSSVGGTPAPGTLDATFHSTGKVITPIGTTSNDGAYAVAIQSDGKIVAAGYSNSTTSSDFALARYTSTGLLDTGFGTAGKVITPNGAASDGAYAVAIQSDGKIVAVGVSYNGVDNDFALARYTSTGSLDTTFNTTGKLTTAIGSVGNDVANAVAIQSDGKIVAAGNSNSGGSGYDFALVRYWP